MTGPNGEPDWAVIASRIHLHRDGRRRSLQSALQRIRELHDSAEVHLWRRPFEQDALFGCLALTRDGERSIRQLCLLPHERMDASKHGNRLAQVERGRYWKVVPEDDEVGARLRQEQTRLYEAVLLGEDRSVLGVLCLTRDLSESSLTDPELHQYDDLIAEQLLPALEGYSLAQHHQELAAASACLTSLQAALQGAAQSFRDAATATEPNPSLRRCFDALKQWFERIDPKPPAESDCRGMFIRLLDGGKLRMFDGTGAYWRIASEIEDIAALDLADRSTSSLSVRAFERLEAARQDGHWDRALVLPAAASLDDWQAFKDATDAMRDRGLRLNAPELADLAERIYANGAVGVFPIHALEHGLAGLLIMDWSSRTFFGATNRQLIRVACQILATAVALDRERTGRTEQELRDRTSGIIYQKSQPLSAALDASLTKRPLTALAVLDLDGFKAINDNFGHDMGDEVIKLVKEGLLAACCGLSGEELDEEAACVLDGRRTVLRTRLHGLRAGDSWSFLPVHASGDEFWILARSESPVAGVREIVDQTHVHVERRLRESIPTDHFGISAGLALAEPGEPVGWERVETLFPRADRGMYRAKEIAGTFVFAPGITAHERLFELEAGDAGVWLAHEIDEDGQRTIYEENERPGFRRAVRIGAKLAMDWHFATLRLLEGKPPIDKDSTEWHRLRRSFPSIHWEVTDQLTTREGPVLALRLLTPDLRYTPKRQDRLVLLEILRGEDKPALGIGPEGRRGHDGSWRPHVPGDSPDDDPPHPPEPPGKRDRQTE